MPVIAAAVAAALISGLASLGTAGVAASSAAKEREEEEKAENRRLAADTAKPPTAATPLPEDFMDAATAKAKQSIRKELADKELDELADQQVGTTAYA